MGPILRLRADLLAEIRAFFRRRGFLEAECPTRVPAPAPEEHIEAETSGDCYLRTSPEMHLKRLLAAGYSRLFFIGPCFRRGERGDLHNPEYTMLEWYRSPGDAASILRDTRSLLRTVTRRLLGGSIIEHGNRRIYMDRRWRRIAVRDAFKRYAGWDPVKDFDADRFDIDLVDKVEPSLPRDIPVVLMDYPAPRAALARLRPGDPAVAERWELHVGGMEIANAYSELTDAAEQRRRFEACNAARRADNRSIYPLDEKFLASLENGLPPCGGIALGIDRLLLLLANRTTLDEVLPFRDG